MKLFCLQQSSIFENYGGVEYYLHDLLSLASEVLEPHSVTTFIPERKPLTLTQTPYEVVPVRYQTTGWFQKWENRFSPLLFQAAYQKAKEARPDFILAGHVSLSPLAYALSKALGIPFWTVAYGLEVWGPSDLPTEWAFRKSGQIISISHWTKNILVSRGFSAEHIQVVHPCLQPSFLDKPAKEYALDSKNPLQLLTVSRLDPQEQYKGQDHVLSALGFIKKNHPESMPHYTIQGRGEDKQRLEQLVFFLGLQDHVTFLDKLDKREDLETLYRNSDLFVMPSRFGCWDGRWRGEGFGIVYVEAAALGVPSLAYQCGGVTDIIDSDSNGILVKPDDIKALASRLLNLHQEREKLALLGKAAKETALRCFSPQAIRKELERVLISGQSIAEIRPSTDSIDVSDVLDPIS